MPEELASLLAEMAAAERLPVATDSTDDDVASTSWTVSYSCLRPGHTAD